MGENKNKQKYIISMNGKGYEEKLNRTNLREGGQGSPF